MSRPGTPSHHHGDGTEPGDTTWLPGSGPTWKSTMDPDTTSGPPAPDPVPASTGTPIHEIRSTDPRWWREPRDGPPVRPDGVPSAPRARRRRSSTSGARAGASRTHGRGIRDSHPGQPPVERPRRWIGILVGLLLPVALIGTAGAVYANTIPDGRHGGPDRHGPNPSRSRSTPAAAGGDCTLVVPANPLSATGLATPYRLVAGQDGQPACHEGNPGEAAYVQATVVDPSTGALSVYNPLVVDGSDDPAVPAVVPALPAGAVVGLWFGFNGSTLRLRDSHGSLADGRCVNGLRNSLFGQFAYCNAPAFFSTANAAVAAHRLTLPPLGTALDGLPCPTTRDFSVVDQDQSDNVTATYLSRADGRMAQNTAVNRAGAGAGSRISVNGSDNRLVDAAIDPALGCTPFTAPDLADPGARTTSLALNELQAAATQHAPVALTPLIDPMTLVGGRSSVDKTNLYRAGVDQPPVTFRDAGGRGGGAGDRPGYGTAGADYCRNLVAVAQSRIQRDRNFTRSKPSPDSAAGDSLFTFLAARLSGSFDMLGCGRLLRAANPVKLIRDGGGVATDATFAVPTAPVPLPSPSADQRALAPLASDPDGGLPITQPHHF